MVQSIQDNGVLFIGYHVRTDRFVDSGVLQLRVAAVRGLADPSCKRYSVTINTGTRFAEHWQPGVSRTVGLLEKPFGSADVSFEAEVLERVLADLMAQIILDAATANKDSIIVAKGPALSKVVGRLGYLCLPKDITALFLTADPWWSIGPKVPCYSRGKWSGPFPPYHDDCLIRTFYSSTQSLPSQIPARVDIFYQDFGPSSKTDIASEISRRIEKLDCITATHPPKFPKNPYPRPLEVLSRSLRWSEDEFGFAIQQHKLMLGDIGISEAVIVKVEEDGILSLEPSYDSACHEFTNSEYKKEILYEKLQVGLEEMTDEGKALAELLSPQAL